MQKFFTNSLGIPIRFAEHNMSSKIVGWLVWAQDGKFLEYKFLSGINKNYAPNLVSLVHIFYIIFQEFLGFSKIEELVL